MIHIHISDNPLYYISFARRIQVRRQGARSCAGSTMKPCDLYASVLKILCRLLQTAMDTVADTGKCAAYVLTLLYYQKVRLKKAGQHTPPRRSHTVIPSPAFVQSGIVFSVCGLSIQTRSAPFRTIPERYNASGANSSGVSR